MSSEAPSPPELCDRFVVNVTHDGISEVDSFFKIDSAILGDNLGKFYGNDGKRQDIEIVVSGQNSPGNFGKAHGNKIVIYHNTWVEYLQNKNKSKPRSYREWWDSLPYKFIKEKSKFFRGNFDRRNSYLKYVNSNIGDKYINILRQTAARRALSELIMHEMTHIQEQGKNGFRHAILTVAVPFASAAVIYSTAPNNFVNQSSAALLFGAMGSIGDLLSRINTERSAFKAQNLHKHTYIDAIAIQLPAWESSIRLCNDELE